MKKQVERLAVLGLVACMAFGGNTTALAESKKAIESVTEVKKLPGYMYYCVHMEDDLILQDDRVYVNKNFDEVFRFGTLLNGENIYMLSPFFNGLAVIQTTVARHHYLIDTSFQIDVELGTVDRLYVFEKGEDPNDVHFFAYTAFTDALQFITYTNGGEVFKTLYYYEDYPELRGVNQIDDVQDGKASLFIRQYGGQMAGSLLYEYTDKNVATINTLGELSTEIVHNTHGKSYYLQDNRNRTTTFSSSGAYLEKSGHDKFVLKDATGKGVYEFKRNVQTDKCEIQIIDDETFIGIPYGKQDDSWYLYKIKYKDISTSQGAGGQWKQDAVGWWYQNPDGSYPKGRWQEINAKHYYFDGAGYMLHDTTTSDGYEVGSDGAWIIQ